MRIAADNTVRYYHTDALGSVIALSDATGAIQTRYTYDPYGNVTVTGAASDNPFQFAGRENDGTGLLFERARYYSFELQRYISEDPIGFAGGDVNMYVRIGNNPVNFFDPSGLEWVKTEMGWRYHYEPGELEYIRGEIEKSNPQNVPVLFEIFDPLSWLFQYIHHKRINEDKTCP
jgi:RHS repeat-associated protein